MIEKEIIKKQGSVTEIPLESDSVDCILLADVFEHVVLEDLDKLLSELDEGMERGDYTPEMSVTYHDGDFNIEYVVIKSSDGKEVYRDESYKEKD